MEIGDQARRGVFWNTLATVIGAISQFALVILLSYLLEKDEFGLMAVATFVIGFSQIFIDMGISNAIIYKQEVSREQLSSLYWLNVLSGVSLFVILLLLSPVIASFYNDPRLVSVINWVAVTFLIQPFGTQFAVILQKELQFKDLAVRTIFSKIGGLVVGVILGYLGHGVFSLVFSNLATALIATILLIIPGFKIHRPQLRFKSNELKPFLSFGLYQMGEKITNYFNSQVDTLIIGKILGMETLGVYTVAKDLISRPAQIINPVITRVAFPVMSKFQNDLSIVKKIYLKTLGLLCSINFPIYIFIAIYSESIILLLFGDKWLDAVLILRILSIYFLIRSTANPMGSIQLALGKANWGFYWNVFLLSIVPVSIYIGGFWGLAGVGYAYIATQLLFILPVWKMVEKLCAASFKEYFGSFFNIFIICLISGLLTLGYIYVSPVSNSVLNLIIGFLIFSGLVIAFYMKYNTPFKEELKKALKKN